MWYLIPEYPNYFQGENHETIVKGTCESFKLQTAIVVLSDSSNLIQIFSIKIVCFHK